MHYPIYVNHKLWTAEDQFLVMTSVVQNRITFARITQSIDEMVVWLDFNAIITVFFMIGLILIISSMA